MAPSWDPTGLFFIKLHFLMLTAYVSYNFLAVVDHRLRVYGVSGLRVIDGSIMPTIVSGNPK